MSDPQTNSEMATYSFVVGKKRITVDFSRAFVLGDMLAQRGQFRQAKTVFDKIVTESGRGPRARIMLARCQSAMGEYDACSKTLESAFGEEGSIASDLHSALVYLTLGFREDAIKGLLELAKNKTNLPTLCLVLGDAFAKQGDLKRAKACWKMAISRDKLKGGVAIAANRRLKADDR